MFIFDLHCDTITECLNLNKSIKQNDLHIDLERGNIYEKWIQTFAFWIDDSYRGERAYRRFLDQRNLLMSELQKFPNDFMLYQAGKQVPNHKCNVMMAVEGGHVLAGDIHRIEQLKRLGVCYLTLTWNSDNEIGSGASGSDNGLTDFGKQVIKELERCNIIVDVSHLNEAGFYDVCEIAKKPFIATHSNARTICNHKRNLYDNQLRYLIRHNGLCGINLYPQFINQTKDCSFEDIKRHIDHILTLGGENILAIGSDFDGAAMPSALNGVQTLYRLYDHMVKWFHEKVANKIFYENAKQFVDDNIRFDQEMEHKNDVL